MLLEKYLHVLVLYKSGQQRISRDSGPNEETTVESAAIRIQAAYRGHTVRQSLNWRLPSGDTVQTSHRRGLQEEVGGSDLVTHCYLQNSNYPNSSVLRKLLDYLIRGIDVCSYRTTNW